MARIKQTASLIEGSVYLTVVLCLFLSAMVNIMRITRSADHGADTSASRPMGEVPEAVQADSGGNTSEVSASVSDLVVPEKHKTLVLGPSVVSKNTIEFYVLKGYFKEGDCRPPEGEITPTPKEGDVVVFRDFFTAGLRLPMDPVFPSLLAPFNVKLHHLTPNAMVQLSKFLWAVRTFGG